MFTLTEVAIGVAVFYVVVLVGVRVYAAYRLLSVGEKQ